MGKFIPFTPPPAGTRVVVYRCLTFKDRVVWSVARPTSTDGKGKLIGHVEGTAGITLTNTRAVVGGRAHAVRDGEREVCAWVAGDLAPEVFACAIPITYDRAEMRFRTDDSGHPYTFTAAESGVTFTDRMRSIRLDARA